MLKTRTFFATIATILAIFGNTFEAAADDQSHAVEVSTASTNSKEFEDFIVANCGKLVLLCNNKDWNGPTFSTADDLAEYFRTAKSISESDPLTNNEFLAVFGYTQTFYKSLNSSLRSHDTSMQPFASTLNSALNKLPDFSGIVFRNDHIPESVLASWNVGQIITYDAFMSTSSLDVCSAPTTPFFCEGSHQLLIIKSLHGKFIAKYSANPSEREVLFRSGTRFRIREIKVNQGKMVIYLDELNFPLD